MTEREQIATALRGAFVAITGHLAPADLIEAQLDAVLAQRASVAGADEGYAEAERIVREFTGEKGRQNLTDTRLHTMVVRGLRRFIGDHRQPVTRDMIGSAAKRISEQIRDSIGTILTEERPLPVVGGHGTDSGRAVIDDGGQSDQRDLRAQLITATARIERLTAQRAEKDDVIRDHRAEVERLTAIAEPAASAEQAQTRNMALGPSGWHMNNTMEHDDARDTLAWLKFFESVGPSKRPDLQASDAFRIGFRSGFTVGYDEPRAVPSQPCLACQETWPVRLAEMTGVADDYRRQHMMVVSERDDAREEQAQLREAIKNHEEAHRVGLAHARDLRAQLEQTRADLEAARAREEALRKFLMQYVDWIGCVPGLHAEDCPEDDTCTCPPVAELNALLATPTEARRTP